MKRNILNFNNSRIDVNSINAIIKTNDNTIKIVLNTKLESEVSTISVVLQDEQEFIKTYSKLEKALLAQNKVLLYDFDKDLLVLDNITLFKDPEFNGNNVIVKYMFSNGVLYSSEINVSNDTNDSLEVFKTKMEAAYNEIYNVWLENKPGLYKPFHKIDL